MADPMLEFATFTATACAAGAAGFAAYISYRIGVLSAYPDVVVYTSPDKNRPSIILLVVENVGKAPAYNVVFRPDEELPASAFGLDASSAKPAQKMTSGPIISGVPFLPAGGKRVITWGQFGGLAASLKSNTIRVRAEYYPKEALVGIVPLLQTTSIIEIESFRDTDASDSEPLARIAKALEKRNTHLGIR